MRRVLVVSVLLSLAAGAFALPRGPWPGMDPNRKELNAEITSILDQNAQTQIGTMTVGDMEKIAGEISIAIQKDQYVRDIGRASWLLPGAGQFRTGDTSNGALFLASDIALFTGTILSAYFLLPSNVQFGSMNYGTTSFSDIRSTWQSNSLRDYAPSIAVMIAGTAAQMLLKWVSAKNAEADARNAIASGKVTFQPEFAPLFEPAGPDGKPRFGFGLGFGMNMR